MAQRSTTQSFDVSPEANQADLESNRGLATANGFFVYDAHWNLSYGYARAGWSGLLLPIAAWLDRRIYDGSTVNGGLAYARREESEDAGR